MKNWKEKITRLVKEELERQNLKVSEAHSLPHLKRVAELTQKIGVLYKFSPRENELAYALGWFHDIVRFPSGFGAEDKEASANKARRILTGLITKEEEEVIVYAIKKHDFYPQWLINPKTREKPPETLKEKLHFALFVADKIEQNGVRGIVRRCSFTAGDRLRSEKGDWRIFGFKSDRDEGLVVALASIYRLTFKNPEEIYPLKLFPTVRPLYETQREFVFGLCRGLNLTIENIARLLLETKNDKGENILQAMRISAPGNSSELAVLIASRGGITNERITSVLEDLAYSALETVKYFSYRYRENLSKLIFNWKPRGRKSQEWQRVMKEYKEDKF